MTKFDTNQIAVSMTVWNDMMGGLGSWFKEISKSMKYFADTWFPVYKDMHRVEVKRVHTAYHRKQQARRRRNRKR